ncbi:MAG: class I SAM-dependent methyltransferase [Anaerolineales bacterium]|jgi:23S rRNA (cytosine1962-C5)-methyltransferase
MHSLELKPGRERSVLKRHPWVFSSAVAEVHGDPQPGDTIDIQAHDGEWLARAAYSPHSRIRARIWTWRQDTAVDETLLERRLAQAIGRRNSLLQEQAVDAYREVYAESDGLPGLIVDRYGPHRVVQFLTTGVERWRQSIISLLAARGDCRGIFERSDVEVRKLEGLEPRSGSLWGDAPPELLAVREHGLRFHVDLSRGHKTGFYLDQRENRRKFRALVSGGQVLDCFAYTGAFSAAALAAGAESVLAIDSSEPMLEMAQRNIALNDLPLDRFACQTADVFKHLRLLRDMGRIFDVVVLDPPRFAPTISQVHRAARGYKDVNLLAFKLLRPRGLLVTFSCSGGVSAELFQKIVAGSAQDAGVTATVLDWLGQPPDHPVRLNFPEGRYLKGLVCRVEEGA